MNKDFWDKISRLEELAGKAVSGPWEYDGHGNIDSTDHEAFCYLAENLTEENGEYIAAANPAMILEMITEMRRLEKEANWLAALCAKGCIHKTEDCAFQPSYFMDKPCYGENCKKSFCSMDKKEWRGAARKAVSEDK